MSHSHWHRIQTLFETALEKPEQEREAFLRQACGQDAALFDEVSSLLEADRRTHSLLRGLAIDAVDIPDAILPPDTAVGKYRIIRMLGSGGMGLVYLAERDDGYFSQTVALKVIKRGMSSQDVLQRFQSERQILARLQHPNIARIYDAGLTDEGQPFFTMEFIDGEPIDVYCDKHRLSIEARLQLFIKVCEAVHYAHRNLIVHRDLKPGNILVQSDGTVKLLDFGIAKVLSTEEAVAAMTINHSGQQMMTPEYASPEQVTSGPITTACDVYSLGIILYELLAGCRPYEFPERTPVQIEQVITGTIPQKPSHAVKSTKTKHVDVRSPSQDISHARRLPYKNLQRRLAGDLDNICLLAMRKEPERRYATVAAFCNDISRHLEGRPVSARPATTLYRMATFAKRHKGAVFTTAFALLFLGSIIAYYTARLATERDRAQAEAQKSRQVADFLADLFKMSDPSEARGQSITARELLDRGAQRLENDLASQPAIQANMMEIVGTVYQSLAQFDAATELLEKSLLLRLNLGNDALADIARTRWVLAKVKAQQGNYGAADSLQRQSLRLHRRLYGERHETVAQNLSSLGKIMYQKGRYATADSFYSQALAIRRSLFGEQHQGIAASLDDLGFLMYERGDYAQADSLHRQALAIRLALFGEEHLETAESLNNLGAALYAEGRYNEAEQYMRRALAGRRKLLGDDHPLTTYNRTNLAVLLEARQKFTEAEIMYRDILRKHREKFGPAHPAIADDLTDIGRVQAAQSNYQQAELLFRQALALQLKLRGRQHWLVAYTQNSLGSTLHAQNKTDAAIPVYRSALAIYRQAWEKPNQHVANTLLGYGAALTDLGKIEEAGASIQQGLEIYKAMLPAGHWQLARANSILGAWFAAQGKHDMAAPLLQDSVSQLHAARGEADFNTRYARRWLASLPDEH